MATLPFGRWFAFVYFTTYFVLGCACASTRAIVLTNLKAVELFSISESRYDEPDCETALLIHPSGKGRSRRTETLKALWSRALLSLSVSVLLNAKANVPVLVDVVDIIGIPCIHLVSGRQSMVFIHYNVRVTLNYIPSV